MLDNGKLYAVTWQERQGPKTVVGEADSVEFFMKILQVQEKPFVVCNTLSGCRLNPLEFQNPNPMTMWMEDFKW